MFASSGTFQVRLTVTNSRGTSNITHPVTVLPAPPKAAFTWAPPVIGVGVPVQFTDTSDGATSWSWDFGDGTALSTDRNPAHPFAASRAYPVRLTVRNSAGESQVTHTVSVNPPAPIAAFTFTPATGITTATAVQFTNTSTGGVAETYEWTFDDGSPAATVASPSHVFLTAGTHNVRLRVTNISGSNEVVHPVVVTVPAPTASFTAPATAVANNPVQFTSTSSGTGITAYTWNWGDGTPPLTSADATPLHTYAAAGTFPVTLTVTNPGGTNTSPARNITIVAAPVATFTAPATAVAGQAVAFNSAGSVGTLAWDYGDGSTGTAATHQYNTPGKYSISLVATSGGVSVTSAPREITINPDARFTYAAASGGQVQFTSQSIGATGYQWTFSAGTTCNSVTAANPLCTFPGAGTYTATLVATGPDGTASSPETTQLSTDVPVADFTFSQGAGSSVSFTNMSTGGPFVSVLWEFSAGTPATSTAANPSHTFPGIGAYNVTLTVTTAGGTDSVTRSILVI
jgi:PKD repeat protein